MGGVCRGSDHQGAARRGREKGAVIALANGYNDDVPSREPLKTSSFIFGDGYTQSELVFGLNQSITSEFALGDQKFLIVYDHAKRSYIRIYDFKKALAGDKDGEKEIAGPVDHLIT